MLVTRNGFEPSTKGMLAIVGAHGRRCRPKVPNDFVGKNLPARRCRPKVPNVLVGKILPARAPFPGINAKGRPFQAGLLLRRGNPILLEEGCPAALTITGTHMGHHLLLSKG